MGREFLLEGEKKWLFAVNVYIKKYALIGSSFGWVKVMDERPILLKDNLVISDYGNSFIGYYDYNKRDREFFYDVNALEKIYECPSYWLKGLELHEQERIANKEYKQRLVARKEAESVLQTVSNADES